MPPDPPSGSRLPPLILLSHWYSKDSSSEARFQILEGSRLQNQKFPYSTNIDTLNEIPEVG